MNKHDLGLLVSLDVLLDEANVTRAAKRLNLTQPALSAQLSRLRQTLGDPLLVAAERGRGMRLTPRAEQLRTPLHELLGQLAHLVETPYAFDPVSARRDFAIALNDNAATMVGLSLVERIRQLGNPQLRVALFQVGSDEASDLAARGRVDLVIGTRAFLPAGLREQELLGDAFLVAQRKGHPRGTAPMSLEAYCAFDHVLVSPRGGYHSAIDDQLGKMGLARRVTVSVQNYTIVPSLLERTDCLATLPARFLSRFDGSIDVFDPPIELEPFRLLAGWHPRFDDDLGHQWLRSQLMAGIPGSRDTGPRSSENLERQKRLAHTRLQTGAATGPQPRKKPK